MILNKKRMRNTIITLALIFLIIAWLPSTAFAADGIAVSGTFGNFEYKMVPGESIDTPDINIIFFNNYNHDIQVKLSGNVPEGVYFHLDKEMITMKANSNITIPVGLTVGEDVVPGEYVIGLAADVISDSSGVTVTGSAELRTKLYVYGEAGTVTIITITKDEEPIPATIKLDKIEDNQKLPMAFSENGVLEDRIIPGDYSVRTYWDNTLIGEQEFTVDADEEKEILLSVQTIFIDPFLVAPQMAAMQTNDKDDASNGQKIASVKLIYTVNNIYLPLNHGKYTLNVFRDGKLLEQIEILTVSVVEVGSQEYTFTYIPYDGWKPGVYDFSINLSADSTTEQGVTNDYGVAYAQSINRQIEIDANGVVISAGIAEPLTEPEIEEEAAKQLPILIIIICILLIIGLYFIIKFRLWWLIFATCKDCHGEKVFVCPYCEGEDEHCVFCNGIGELLCANCAKHTVKCEICEGKGSINGILCSHCNGVGKVQNAKRAKTKDGKVYKLGYVYKDTLDKDES